MDLSTRLYIEIDIICIMILMIMGYKSMRNLDKRKQQKLFIATILSIQIFVLLDLAWSIADGIMEVVPVIAGIVINSGYFLISGVIVGLWFFYSENVQESKISKEWKYKLIAFIPFIIHTMLILMSVEKGYVFYIEADGDYQRGSLFWLQQLIMFGSVTFTSIKALYKSTQKKNYAKKKEYQVLALFATTPFMLGLIQIGFEGMPITGVGMTLGILLVYANLQELKISKDSLTGLDNRNHMVKVLSYKMNHPQSAKMLTLLMIDVNGFKAINDRFGHVEGDAALIRVAEGLKIISGRWECTAIRYGGDEFILIHESESEAEIETLCQDVREVIKKKSTESGKEYELSVSIGYAVCSDKIRFIPDLISIADRELYREKEELRKGLAYE